MIINDSRCKYSGRIILQRGSLGITRRLIDGHIYDPTCAKIKNSRFCVVDRRIANGDNLLYADDRNERVVFLAYCNFGFWRYVGVDHILDRITDLAAVFLAVAFSLLFGLMSFHLDLAFTLVMMIGFFFIFVFIMVNLLSKPRAINTERAK